MSKLIVPKMYSPEDIDKMVENEYLGFPAGFDESEMYNVLLDASRSQEFDNNPVMEILDVMSQPQYFYYTCKWLLNIHLLPFQVVMLQELWLRKFPMLLATRGGGKSFLLALYALLRAVFTQGSKIVVVGAAFRQSKLMFEYMEQLWRGAPILRNMVGDGKHQGPKRDIDRCTFYIGDSEVCAIPLGDGCCESNTLITNMNCFSYIKHSCEHVWGNGKFRYTDEHYDNGVKPTKIVKTKQGFSFEATLNHKMKVCRQRQIVWVRADEMVVGDRILIDRSVRWHNGKFECTEDEAYVVGALIGDGCWTNPYRLTFATMDKELSDCLQRIDSKWYQTDEAHWNRDGKEHKREWLEHWGLKDKCYAKDKVIPPTLLSAPRSCMTACLQGLFDTDGHIQISTKKGGTSVVIGFTNTSKELVRQMQYILLHYGIVAYVQERDRNVKWNRAYELLITGQDAVKFGEQIGFRLERKKVLLGNALKDKIRTTVVGDTIPGVREEMMRIAKNHKVRGLGSVGYSKIAERKEITFQFAENFLHRYGAVQDPFIDELKQLCNRDIYYDTITSIEDSTAHTYDMHVPEDHEYCAGGFFSHNTKIRGLRAHYTLADEFACLDKDSLVETTNGLVRISDFERLNGEVLTGESNVSEYPSQFIKTPLCDVYQITLQNGYVIKCSENHKVMTHEGWKKPLELCDTDYVLRSDDTMVFGVSQPTNGRLIDILDSNGAFVMGDFYRHCATVEDKVPSDILQAPRDILTSFLCGLLNTDALESCTRFCSKSERLCRDVQVLMYKLGFEGAVHMNDSHFVWSRQFTVLTPYLKVESVVKLEHQDHLYDYHLPVAHCFYADGFKQHNSIPLEIFEVVIKGFASVSASPVQRTKDMARIKVLQSLGMYAEADDVDVGFGNQTVISGTAYYSFNHFYDYWKRYKQIIESRGDKHLLEEIFKGEVPEGFDWTQFSIFRVPWEKLPHGFMDETQIHQAKATVHRSTFLMEYSAIFSKDSDGFFKRSLIESCVCKSPIDLPSGPVQFSAVIRGNPNCKYVYGIDPASEKDNFAIIILEIHPDHRRIVYAWSINRQKLRERIKQGGKTTQKSFYTYCARKIRDLMRLFPTDHIAIDTQGGGIAIMEALHDPDEFDASRGEKPLWPYIRRGENDVFWWEQPNKPTDGEAGLHNLHMVQFANADFTRDANHFMRKDFESKTTLFPMFDPATISEAISLDKIHGRDYDTLEDCVMDIEELKDELATIIHDQTAAGRDRWDTPEVKLPGNKKGRLRKDRYSALLIANMVAHVMEKQLEGVQHEFVGGFAGQRRRHVTGRHYIGPEHIVSKMQCGHYGKGVSRQ